MKAFIKKIYIYISKIHFWKAYLEGDAHSRESGVMCFNLIFCLYICYNFQFQTDLGFFFFFFSPSCFYLSWLSRYHVVTNNTSCRTEQAHCIADMIGLSKYDFRKSAAFIFWLYQSVAHTLESVQRLQSESNELLSIKQKEKKKLTCYGNCQVSW